MNSEQFITSIDIVSKIMYKYVVDIYNNKNFQASGVDLVEKNKLTMHHYNISINFSGFENFQWESFFNVNHSFNWRINSFEFINSLIAHHYISKNDNALNICRDGMMSWWSRYMNTDETYPFKYIWHDMGTAMRVENMIMFIMYTYKEANEWFKQNSKLYELLLSACIAHGILLCKDKFYTKHTNHGLYQSKCLMFLSLFLSHNNDIKSYDFTLWKKMAQERIFEELISCFTEEGVHTENSPAYHSFVLKMFIQLYQDYPEEIIGKKFYRKFTDIVQKALVFLACILRPDKLVPIIGDTELLPVSDYYADFKHTREYTWFKHAQTGGAAGETPPFLHLVFPESGYAVFRNHWPDSRRASEALHLVVKAGQKSRYHRQCDEGNIVLYAFDEDWLIDSGLYSYNDQDPIRAYMRSRAAHNIPLVSTAQYYGIQDCLERWSVISYGIAQDIPFVEMDINVLKNINHNRKVIYDRVNESILVHDIIKSLDNELRSVLLQWHIPIDKKINIDDNNNIKVYGKNRVLGISCDLIDNINVISWSGYNIGSKDKRIFSKVSYKFDTVNDSQVIRIGFEPSNIFSVVTKFKFQRPGSA